MEIALRTPGKEAHVRPNTPIVGLTQGSDSGHRGTRQIPRGLHAHRTQGANIALATQLAPVTTALTRRQTSRSSPSTSRLSTLTPRPASLRGHPQDLRVPRFAVFRFAHFARSLARHDILHPPPPLAPVRVHAAPADLWWQWGIRVRRGAGRQAGHARVAEAVDKVQVYGAFHERSEWDELCQRELHSAPSVPSVTASFGPMSVLTGDRLDGGCEERTARRHTHSQSGIADRQDFELALQQLTYLVVSPRRVSKQAYYHKQTKNVWARDE